MKELSSTWKQDFRRRLRRWYRAHRRNLPWRQSRDPYLVWVSEIMLQQTQVATVRDYFVRFIDRFPSVEALAEADEQDVLRLWEGLGYYRRARQLHAAAKQVCAQHDGALPCDIDGLLQLPGIGRYTAGAIASIAFDHVAPILEANTQRLYARLIGYAQDPAATAGQKALWQTAEALVPRKNPGEFNQALMELGSLVCTPREPDCKNCPVDRLCNARQTGRVDRIPPPKQRKQYQELHEAAIVVQHREKVLLRQCGDDERWAGLWDFPRTELNGEPPQSYLADYVRTLSGVSVDPPHKLTTIKHGVTQYRITLDCYLSTRTGGRLRSRPQQPIKWVARPTLDDIPLSTTGRKIAELVNSR